MAVPFIDLQIQYKEVQDEIEEAVLRVMRSTQYILGEQVRQLESTIARYCGVKHAIGCASGTDALLLCLLAYGIGKNDEVITTPFTFFATAGVIHRVGARVVFADVDERNFNLDIKSVESKITAHTKAIIPVHIFGQSVDMDPLVKLCAGRGIKVIEDCCQAIGAGYRNRKVGASGDAGCFSFFPTKNLGGGGDGGMIVTNDDEIAEKLRLLRVHGARKRYYHLMVGLNSRLDEIQAAIVNVKAKHLDRWNRMRRKSAELYNQYLSGLDIVLPREEEYATHVYHQYVIRTANRDRLNAALNARGIGTGVYYPVPLHLQKCFADLGYKEGDLPVAEKLCREVLSLPMFAGLTEEQIREVANALEAEIAAAHSNA